MLASWPALVQHFDVPIRVSFFQHDNMASKGGRDDSKRSKKEKPTYDGKVSSWPAFAYRTTRKEFLERATPADVGDEAKEAEGAMKAAAMVANAEVDEDPSDGKEWQPVVPRRRAAGQHAWRKYGENPQPATEPPATATSSVH